MKRAKLSMIFRKDSAGLLAFAGLVLVAAYTAWHANYYEVSNSDNLVYPYLFQHFRLHDMVLPGQHSNILKFPLFILQAFIPYNFTTASIVNVGLVLLSLVSWVWLLTRLLGRRSLTAICLVLGSILLLSSAFSFNFIGTTIRNIEYPIALAFIMYCGQIIASKELTRRTIAIGTIIAFLYACACSGDSFFIYSISLPLLLTLLLASIGKWSGRAYRRRTYILLGYIFGAIAFAFILRAFISVLGISAFYTDPAFLPHILPLSHLAPSVTAALTQLLNLCGANIFGQPVRLTNSLIFINFALLLFGTVVMYRYLVQRIRSIKDSIHSSHAFTLTVCFMAFFTTFIIYVASDLVVSTESSGQIVSSVQERYLTLLPLVLIIGVVYGLRQLSHEIKYLPKVSFIALGLGVLLLLGNVHNIKTVNAYNGSSRVGPQAIARVAEDNNIPVLVTGYWDGASTRFWSHNTLGYAVVAGCNIAAPPINNRVSWYNPNSTIHRSALVIDRTGDDAPYWRCTDQQLEAIYGIPAQVIHVKNPVSSPVLWVYNYDIRAKIQPLRI